MKNVKVVFAHGIIATMAFSRVSMSFVSKQTGAKGVIEWTHLP